jgi:hypothetical protein
VLGRDLIFIQQDDKEVKKLSNGILGRVDYCYLQSGKERKEKGERIDFLFK